MYSLIKNMALIFLCGIWGLSFAEQNQRYVLFKYNFHSINTSINDKQCEDMFKSPIFYQIKNDQVIYEPNASYTISDYKRTNVTFIEKGEYLFTGTSTLSFDFNGKKQETSEDINFLLKLKAHRIQGSFIIKGFCKGNLVGVEENVHQWSAPSV